jgi:uncharacterized protein (UPF0212 family)
MKYDCPHCGENLRMKFIKTVAAEGERKFLPAIGRTVCPVCGKTIAANPHWTEIVVSILACVPVFLLLNAASLNHYKTQAIIGIVIWLASTTGFLIWAHFRHLRHWQRYRAA